MIITMTRKSVILRFGLTLVLTYFGTILFVKILSFMTAGATAAFSLRWLAAGALRDGWLAAAFISFTLLVVIEKFSAYLAPVFIGNVIYESVHKKSSRREALVGTLLVGVIVPVATHLAHIHWSNTNLYSLVRGSNTAALIQVIQDKNFDPNTPIPEMKIPLLYDILCNSTQHLAAVPILLGKAGVDVNRGPEHSKKKPLECAILRHLDHEVGLLISHPDLVVKIRDLNYAISRRHTPIVRKLLNVKKSEINMEETSGHFFNPLQAAAYYGVDVEVVNLLLEVPGIDVNKRAASDRTALMIAIHEEHNHIANLLIEDPRSDLSVVNVNGESALTLAREKKNHAILKRLAEKGIR